MASNKQTRANRENAKKSTGPRTAAGKTRSSKNALKHGLLSQDSVLPGEAPEEFDRQLTAIEDWVLPRNPLEREICRQIADAAWRMQRLSRIETAMITAKMNHVRTYVEQIKSDVDLDREDQTRLLGKAMLGGTQSVVQLSRYDGHLTRRFYRAVELLTEIRQGERKSREAREARHKGDHGFDVYSPTAPPEFQHQYIPAKPDIINRAAPNRAVPNRAAHVSERYETNPQDHKEGGGPEASHDRAPTSHRVPTNDPVNPPTAETRATTSVKAPPLLR